MKRHDGSQPTGGFLAPYLTFILCAYLLAILFISVFLFEFLPCGERQEHIPLLVRHFVQQFAQRMNRAIDTISCETMNALVRYSWPGNIRELQNLIERAVILSTGPVLRNPSSGVTESSRCHLSQTTNHGRGRASTHLWGR